MVTLPTNAKIYRTIVNMLEYAHLERRDIISRCIRLSGIGAADAADMSVGGAGATLRSRIGTVLSEMEARELIKPDSDGLYYLVSARPIVIRVEKCEKEIISLLSKGELHKSELRKRLQDVFGTHKTATTRDDDTLSTLMGQLLKRLESCGIIKSSNGTYRLSANAKAKSDDMNAMLELREDFLKRLHSRGGEFFEHYFMTLLSKYSEKHHKKVIECYVTGGSADGGIDGVMKTEDPLGFRETTMVQTKNRVEIMTETDVRGFFGAVCAKKGTRGMFVTSSDFHPNAVSFMEPLDDLVGINGNRVFEMALEVGYGIKKNGATYSVDPKII